MPHRADIRIADLMPGETITSYFALRSKQLRERNGSAFIRFEFVDRTGRIMSVVSEDVDEMWGVANENDIVKVRATVATWNDRKTLRIHRIRRATADECDLSAIVPTYPGNRDDLWREFVTHIDSLSDAGLRSFFEHVAQDVDERELLMTAPAGKLWHHTYIGGLLEHANSVAAIVSTACEKHPTARRDLAVAGALVHDIGKTRAFAVSATIEYTNGGRLTGHVALGERLVRTWCTDTTDLDAETAEQLCHIVLAHQRLGDHPSPVSPMTIEAALVASANEMDATAAAFDRIIEREGGQGQTWSAWVNTLQRQVFLGAKQNSGNS